MNAVYKLLHRIIYGSRTISDRAIGCYFCSDCAKAAHGRCTVKNREVREVSRACSGFVMGGER